MNINTATIVGRITRQPELKSTPSGMKITTFSIATNRTYTKDGQRQEDTEYHNIVVFGKQAETCAQWLQQGQEVGVIGRIQTRSWDKDGVKHYRTEIIADDVSFGSKSGDGQSGGERREHKGRTTSAPAARKPEPEIEYPTEDIDPDDIPF